MPGQCNRAVRLDLHSLIAADGLEVIQVKLRAGGASHEQLANLLAVSIFAVWRQSHDLAFVAIFVVADEFANHRVEASKGMRQKNAIEDVDITALASRHHG